MLSAITRRRFSFRTHLIVFALLVAMPVTVLAGVLLVRSINAEYGQAETRLRQLATALSENIERDVERHVLVLNTLSTLPAFGADWRVFDDRARRALQGDGYIVVADGSFRQLVNTYVPYGRQPARTGDVETAQRVLASKSVEVSSVFTSLVTGGPVINIDIPIIQDGQVQYILMYGRPVAHLTRILQDQALDPGWTSSVSDRHGTLITRTAGATPLPLPAAAPGSSGVSRLTDSAGNTILRATRTSEVTGWTVAVDVPASVAMGEANRTLAWWMLFAVGTIAVAVGLAFLFGQFLSRQLRDAAIYAGTIAEEDSAPPPRPATLHEVGLITQALQSVGTELRMRMERQRLLSRELNHRVKNLLGVVQAVVTRTLSSSRPVEQSRELVVQRLQALGRSQDLLMRSDWTDLPLRQIVDMEISPFADRVECEGPDVLVRSQSVQNFGLLMHELTTNAVKHGALRDGVGTVSVRWSVDDGAADNRFSFQWKEHGQPAGFTLAKGGFGTTLLRSVFRAPDTVYRLEIEPDGFSFAFDAALHLVTGRRPGEQVELESDRSAGMPEPNSAPASAALAALKPA